MGELEKDVNTIYEYIENNCKLLGLFSKIDEVCISKLLSHIKNDENIYVAGALKQIKYNDEHLRRVYILGLNNKLIFIDDNYKLYELNYLNLKVNHDYYKFILNNDKDDLIVNYNNSNADIIIKFFKSIRKLILEYEEFLERKKAAKKELKLEKKYERMQKERENEIRQIVNYMKSPKYSQYIKDEILDLTNSKDSIVSYLLNDWLDEKYPYWNDDEKNKYFEFLEEEQDYSYANSYNEIYTPLYEYVEMLYNECTEIKNKYIDFAKKCLENNNYDYIKAVEEFCKLNNCSEYRSNNYIRYQYNLVKNEFSINAILDAEGNKFKAINDFRKKFNVSIDEAKEYIDKAYNKINNNSK